MILYYSGTGNSKYVAKRIAEITNDDCLDLFERLKNNNIDKINSTSPFVVVTPTYAWQIPHIVRDYLQKNILTGCKNIYFVMTCGGEIGNAAKYLKRLCASIDMNYMGCAEIVMPENYIAMFGVPDKNTALRIVDNAEPLIKRTAKIIASGEEIKSSSATPADIVKSSIVNAVFYPVFVHSKKFTVSDKCISCGKCAKSCVMNNIELSDGKPKWGDSCTHCMACICLCPVRAIEYGGASKGKPQYVCPKSI